MLAQGRLHVIPGCMVYPSKRQMCATRLICVSRSNVRSVAIVGALTILFLTCARKAGNVPVPAKTLVRICDVITNPARYQGKSIQFRARFSSDCYHGYDGLNDFTCRYRGIPAHADRAMSESKQKALYDALCPGLWNYDKDVTAVFTGVVRRVDPNSSLLWPPPGFECVITDYRELKSVKRSFE